MAKAGSAPHHAFRNLARKYGPIMHLQFGEISAVIVSAPRVEKEVLKTHNLAFTSMPKLISPEIITYNYLDVSFSPYGGYWKQMRKIYNLELLSAKNVQSFSSIRDEELFAFTNNVVGRAAFRDRCKDQAEVILLNADDDLMASAGGFDVANLYPSIKILRVISGLKSKLMKLPQKSDKVLNKIINEHKERLANKEKFNQGWI
ncbi:Cytochrome [Abeliophyllum distichum]|uniref:Cytochrome n=1 Tax=Abeliophyllum distichum TaxID=126358 RepID=A0ABD1QHR5_9LAMI